MNKKRFRRTKSTLKNPAVWSNVLWCVPMVVALYYGNVYLALPAVFVLMTSSLYHLTYNRTIELLDDVGATAYVAIGFYLVWVSGFTSPYTEIAAIIIIFGFYMFLHSHRVLREYGWHRYRSTHKWWHLSSALAAVVVYAMYFQVGVA